MADIDPLLAPSDDRSTGENDDWPARASATIVEYVGTVRDKTTGPALAASRNLVYLLAIGLISIVAAILALILTVRLVVVATGYIPGVDPGETWPAYLILGASFVLPGSWLWRKKEL
ncbi:MAG: hypothetical protein GY724_12315 [Actinomycetia bacterium]|nr:hypothetical protein [Actinomycetes bacterium]MCP4228080.1 hypothetical protein [Actinomycetes bacterium]MCP5033376.1 hypothetical protein [Actinomycetes bacterium]